MSHNHVVEWAAPEPVEVLAGLVRRTLGVTGDLMLVEWRAKEGVSLPAHSHPHQQVGYVVSGAIDITIDGVTTHCEPGDSWEIPGGIEHSAHFPVESVVIDCFSPPREDYA